MQRMLAHVCDFPQEWAKMGSAADGYVYDTFDFGDDSRYDPPSQDAHWWEHEPHLHYLRAGRLEESLTRQFPEEASGIRSYLREVDRATSFFDGTNALMLTKFSFVPGFVKAWLHTRVGRLASRTAREVVEEHVTDPRLRAMLSAGQMIDWNLPPGDVSFLVAAGMLNYYEGGGYYPVGTSNSIPASILPEIERTGGAVLCKADVSGIITDTKGGILTATGVRMANGDEIRAPMVVSAAGFANTFDKFLSPEQLFAAGLDEAVRRTHAMLKPSHSHICAYISLDGPAEQFELHPWNVHSFPDAPHFDYDIDRMQATYYADPFSLNEPLMTLTCPSAKDPAYPNSNSANVLLLIEGLKPWFEEWGGSTHGRRPSEYEDAKGKFEQMFLDRLFKYYPTTRGHVTHVELSTPLTAEHFLNAPAGASYGLEWTPAHFDQELHETVFSPKTPIQGLFVSGESVCFGGYFGALATSFATASHILGPLAFAKMMLEDRSASWPRFAPADELRRDASSGSGGQPSQPKSSRGVKVG